MKKILSGFLSAVLLCAANVSWAATSEGREGLLALGSAAPDFKLEDVTTGETVSRDDFAGKKAFLVMFICRHCPFVQRVKEGLAALAKDYSGKDIAIVAISANDPKGYADDSPESLKEMAEEEDFIFPVLFDDTQDVAKAYTAVVTPDIFLFDGDRKLVYRGQFDGARPGNDVPVTGEDLRAAIDSLLEGKPVSKDQKHAVGCSIKWKPGNEPPYFR